MNTLLTIKSATKTYGVQTEDTLNFISKYAAAETSFFVIDQTVYDLYTSAFSEIPPARLFLLEAKEENKTIETALTICEKIIELNSKRNTRLFSFGGGIIQDITGFVANILYRGIHWTFVPTTLLAACDSCIGGKSSLNYKNYKNLLGTFFPPDEIIIYADFFKTLSRKDLLSGLGEVVKFNIIAGEDTMCSVQRSLDSLINCDMAEIKKFIQSSLMFKKTFIEADEFDRNERIKLNFAHTFGHAIEVSSHYEIPHGTAVAMGVIVANAISVKRGLMSETFAKKVETIIAPILDEDMSDAILNPEILIAAIRKDKKQVNAQITAILLDSDYKLHLFSDVQADEVTEGFLHLASFIKNK